MEQVQNGAKYIAEQLQAGLRADEIAGQLRAANWPEEQISHAFERSHQLMMVAVQPVQPTQLANPVPAQSQPVEAQSNVQQAASQSPLGQQVQQDGADNGKKRGKISSGWLLFKQSMRVLRNNRALVKYPIISGLFSFLVLAIFSGIFFAGGKAFYVPNTTSYSNDGYPTPIGLVVALVYYVASYFVVNYYAAGLSAHVLDLFHGSSQPRSVYMQKARSKIKTIFLFSLLSATIGMILRMIAERSALLGRIVARILGALWTIASLFVVPTIVSSDRGVKDSIKHSVELIKSTWGENIVGRAGMETVFALLFMFVMIPVYIGLFILAAATNSGIAIGIVAFLCVVSLFVFAIVTTTASSVLNTALFYYAEYRQVPAAYDPELLNNIFIPKKPKRGLFSKKK